MTDRVLLPPDPTVAELVEKRGAVGWAIMRARIEGRPTAEHVLIRCQCGRVMGMATHSIAEDGTVSPSLHHHDDKDPGHGCGWHVFGRLVGWDKR